MMREMDLRPGDLEVIGLDGQTINQEAPVHDRLPDVTRHETLVARWLDGPYGCGLGAPSIIAAACQTPTVTHVRPMDHALGGTGAPLMQYLDFAAFRDLGPVLTLNIGGIANCQLAHADRARMMAFDTGPGNVMMDHAMTRLCGQPYDRNGEVAATGRVDGPMLEPLKGHVHFQRPIPRSAWRLDFGSRYADGILAQCASLSPTDILATRTDFTACAISRSIRDKVPDLGGFKKIIASGGGGGFLLQRLQAHLPQGLGLVTSDKQGIPPQFKEAVKFATPRPCHGERSGQQHPRRLGRQRPWHPGQAGAAAAPGQKLRPKERPMAPISPPPISPPSGAEVPLLDMRSIAKSFGPVPALRDGRLRLWTARSMR